MTWKKEPDFLKRPLMSKKAIKSGNIFDNWVILDSNERK